jgi:hypothetical protein
MQPQVMGTVIKKVEAWPLTFGGKEHCGWLPPHAATPKATPVEKELLHVRIEQCDGGYLLIWEARTSATCGDVSPPKSGDTWHETLEDAEKAAHDHFGIEHGHWADILGSCR